MKPIFQKVSVLFIILFGPIGFANSDVAKPNSVIDKANLVSINEADDVFNYGCLSGSDPGYENGGSGYSFHSGSFVTTNQQHVFEGIYSVGVPAAGASVTSPTFPVTGGVDFELFYAYKSLHSTIDQTNLIEITFRWYDSNNVEIAKSIVSHEKISFGRWERKTVLTSSPANAVSVAINYLNNTSNIVYFDSGCFAESVNRELSVNDASTDEGSNLVFTININEPFYEYTDINISYNDNTAINNEDYTPTKFSLDIPPYTSSVRFSVPTTEDNIFEINETFNTEITSATAGVTVGDGIGTGTILDNEASTGPSSINFDGEDDYLIATPFIENWSQATVMSWVKIESNSTGTLPNIYSIAGQENMKLFVTAGRTPAFSVITQAQVSAANNFPTNIQVQPDPLLNIELQNDLWYHLTGVFNSIDQTIKLYLNGRLINTVTDAQLSSTLLTQNFDGSPHIYSSREFTIGRYPTNTSGFGYFDGEIDEVRVFDTALTESQIQHMVYQEIKPNESAVGGAIVPKSIVDSNSNASVAWANLSAYYPMTDILNGKTNDISGNARTAFLHNISTINPQTAPMPYETKEDGAWTEEATWLHGNVWDIEDVANNRDWSIVKINNNVSTVHSHTNLGLIIDSNSSLKVNNDQAITNTWYLQLDGVLDLQNDSQLIQSNTSDLVTSNQGRILRRQEGNTSVYWYNYLYNSLKSAINQSCNN